MTQEQLQRAKKSGRKRREGGMLSRKAVKWMRKEDRKHVYINSYCGGELTEIIIRKYYPEGGLYRLWRDHIVEQRKKLLPRIAEAVRSMVAIWKYIN